MWLINNRGHIFLVHANFVHMTHEASITICRRLLILRLHVISQQYIGGQSSRAIEFSYLEDKRSYKGWIYYTKWLECSVRLLIPDMYTCTYGYSIRM